MTFSIQYNPTPYINNNVNTHKCNQKSSGKKQKESDKNNNKYIQLRKIEKSEKHQ